MILHVLGGGPAQLGAIRRAKERGFRVAVSDINPQAPGLAEADFPSLASSFDTGAVLRDARKIGSDCLLATGTDQPVLTAAEVSHALGRPYFLTPPQARMVTNKKVMKQALRARGLPTRPSVFLSQDFREEELEDLNFPLVIKPLDSQGQRGVLRVESPEEIRRRFAEVLSFSRQREILAEEYYPSTELTISGWVEEGSPSLLSVTDRVTIDNGPHLGVCLSHRYPSLCHRDWDTLERLTADLTAMIGLEKGPLYFQILAGEEGYVVNEIACRLGGAYEEEFLPWLCGVPLLDMMIDMTARREYNRSSLRRLASAREGKFFSLQMFFCRPGVIARQTGMDRVTRQEQILGGRFLLREGTTIRPRENSTQRAGYFMTAAGSPRELNRLIKESYKTLSIRDAQGREMIEWDERMLYPHEKTESIS